MHKRCTVPLLVILAAALAVRLLLGPAPGDSAKLATELRAYRQLRGTISQRYVEEVPEEALFFGAMKGMVESADDDYSEFLPPDEYSEMMDDTGGEFGGLGIEIYKDKSGYLAVHTPLLGTPAAKAGIRPGDVIVRILQGGSPDAGDWVRTDEIEQSEAVKLLKGPPGTRVTIEVVSRGEEETRRVAIERARIEVPSVHFAMMLARPGKVGYVDLVRFQDGTEADLAEAIDDLLDEGMRGLILDLRHNPGGTLISAVRTANLFLESGTIVSIRGRDPDDPDDNKVYAARKESTLPKFPVAALVGQGSASAAEILAAALQDHDRATLVGGRTFGKGSVQSIIALDLGEYGKGAVKVTSARYYTPEGISISRKPGAEKWGVDPDIEVSVPDEERRRLWEARTRAWVRLNSDDGGAPVEDWPAGPHIDRAYGALTKVLGDGPAVNRPAPQPAPAPAGAAR